MSKLNRDDNKLKNEIIKLALPDLINSLYKDGIISDSDLLDKKIVFEKLSSYMTKNEKNIDFEIVIDHRNTLIRVAESEIMNGNYEFATAIYATYIEHTLNRIIHLACTYKKIDKKVQTEIIKSVNIIGKCTWLIKLLDLPTFRQEYVKIILTVSNERNSYIHYKWKTEIDSDKILNLDTENNTEAEKLKKIKSLLRYLKNYETKIEYKGKKKQIEQIIK